MAAKITRFEFSDASLARRIALIARDSSKVVLTTHAKRRMRQRGILLTQVMQCLKSGSVVEPAHVDITGCWKCTLAKMIAGDYVKVVAALSVAASAESVIVITVMG